MPALIGILLVLLVYVGITGGLGASLSFLFRPGRDFVSMPKKAPRVQHMATCDANSAAPRSLIVTVGEGGAALNETIQIGRFDFFVSQGMNRVVGLIVGKDE